jgi:hypothetical protein
MAQMPTVSFYANDTHPKLILVLDDGGSPAVPLDLSLVAQVILKVSSDFAPVAALFKGLCVIEGDPTAGTVSYTFTSGQLVAGGWIGEISLKYTDNTVQTMPHFKLKVLPDLAGPDDYP